MYPASDWSSLLRAIMDISARAIIGTHRTSPRTRLWVAFPPLPPEMFAPNWARSSGAPKEPTAPDKAPGPHLPRTEDAIVLPLTAAFGYLFNEAGKKPGERHGLVRQRAMATISKAATISSAVPRPWCKRVEVVRGGSWIASPPNLRSALRSGAAA
jgi:hypothetical protein